MPKFKVVLESAATIQTVVYVEAEDYIDVEDKAIKECEPKYCQWEVVEGPMYNDEVYAQEVEEVTDA